MQAYRHERGDMNDGSCLYFASKDYMDTSVSNANELYGYLLSIDVPSNSAINVPETSATPLS